MTFTEQVAEKSPAVAVMTAFPAAIAVTIPFSTVATLLLSDAQLTVLSVAFSGVTVATRVSVLLIYLCIREEKKKESYV